MRRYTDKSVRKYEYIDCLTGNPFGFVPAGVKPTYPEEKTFRS